MNMPSSNPRPNRQLLTPKTTLAIGICSLAVLAWIAPSHHSQAANDKNQKADPVMFTHQGQDYIVPNDSPLKDHLKVAPVTSGSGENVASFPGMVEANGALSANIEPPLAGRLVKLNVKLGDHVQKGQVLGLVSSGDLAQARSDVAKASDSLHLAEKALKRAQGVNSAGANAVKDLEAAQSAEVQARSEYDRATQRLRTLGGDAGGSNIQAGNEALLPIIAPISGDVTALNVGAGSYMNDNTAAIMTIANLDQVWVTANIPEARLNEVRAGLPVDVLLPAYPDQIFHGRIDTISSVLDSDTRRSKARILFANPGMKLKPNMFATVQIKSVQQHEVSVPPSALLMNNDTVTVFVEAKPGTYVRKTVELGSETDQAVQIVSGLAATDRVIISGGVLLND